MTFDLTTAKKTAIKKLGNKNTCTTILKKKKKKTGKVTWEYRETDIQVI